MLLLCPSLGSLRGPYLCAVWVPHDISSRDSHVAANADAGEDHLVTGLDIAVGIGSLERRPVPQLEARPIDADVELHVNHGYGHVCVSQCELNTCKIVTPLCRW
jgi:hypothetical protein